MLWSNVLTRNSHLSDGRTQLCTSEAKVAPFLSIPSQPFYSVHRITMSYSSVFLTTSIEVPLWAEENKFLSPLHWWVEPKKMGHAQNGFEVSSCIFTIYEKFAFSSLNPCLYSTDLKGEYTWCYRERQHVFPEASCLPRTYLHCYTQGWHFERQAKLKMTSYVKRPSI